MHVREVADSVDVDNLDANLFSSFNKRKKSSDSVRRKPSLENTAKTPSKNVPEQETAQRFSEKSRQASHERAAESKKPLPKPFPKEQNRDDGEQKLQYNAEAIILSSLSLSLPPLFCPSLLPPPSFPP